MKRTNDIPYAEDNGTLHMGDLFEPVHLNKDIAVLVIHGGGWHSMNKESITPLSILIAEAGYMVFNINYRLTNEYPWPACGDDCISAARYMLAERGYKSLIVVGASAGGHLALYTGLIMPPEKVKGIISISGISDLPLQSENPSIEKELWDMFTGGDYGKLKTASPINYVKKNSPPLLCIHSINDKLVKIEQAEFIIEKYHKAGASAKLVSFSGQGEYHGIWEDGHGEMDFEDRILMSEVKSAVLDFI